MQHPRVSGTRPTRGLLSGIGFQDVRAPPFAAACFEKMTIRKAGIDVSGDIGFIPSIRQPLYGTKRPRKGMVYMLRPSKRPSIP